MTNSACPPADHCLLYPYLLENSATLIHAPENHGATEIALLFSVLVATGKNLPGITAREATVLFIDYRTGPRIGPQREFDIKKQHFDASVETLSKGLGVPPPTGHWQNHAYYFGNLMYFEGLRTCSFAEDFEDIRNVVGAYDVSLVVVNDAQSATEQTSDGDASQAYFDALDKLGIASLTVAQYSDDKRQYLGEPWSSRCELVLSTLAKDLATIRLYHEKKPDQAHISARNFIIQAPRTFLAFPVG